VTRLRFCKGAGARACEAELGDVWPWPCCQCADDITLGSSSTSKASGEEWPGLVDEGIAIDMAPCSNNALDILAAGVGGVGRGVEG
jgi:hypothetical protein